MTTRTTDETAAWLKGQHDSGSSAWYEKCLMLQHDARNIPALYPSAFAAMVATPESERVYKVSDLRRGMVAYSDNPNDSNPFGHIYFIAGWKGSSRSDPNELMTWTNDALRHGGVDLVPITWYLTHWGVPFKFGATWLNGYDFSEFNKPAKPVHGTLGSNYEHAIADIEKAIVSHKKTHDDRIVNALNRDLARMKKHYKKFS